MLPPNRMTAYKQARAAERPKGMGYTELFFDNIIGLDNNYESGLESMVDAYNADKTGFLKNAAVGAYEGAKTAVMNPLTTAEGLISGLYDSGANVLSTLGPGGEAPYLDSALMEMYGVTYDQATDDQVNKAREALFGDVLNVAGVASGVGAGAKVAGGLKAGSRAAAAEALPGPGPDRSLSDLVGMAYRGEPLTEQEAFDVMTYERYGPDGVYDPTNTLENWSAQAGDNEGALRLAHLTGYMPGGGQNPLARVPGPYFADDIDFEPDDAYFDAQDRMLAAQTPITELYLSQAEGRNLNPAELQRIADYEAERQRVDDNYPLEYQRQPDEPTDFFQQPTLTPLARMPDWDESEYVGLLQLEARDQTPEEAYRINQYDEVRYDELSRINPEDLSDRERYEMRDIDDRMSNYAANQLPPPPPPNDVFGVNPQGFNPPDPWQFANGNPPPSPQSFPSFPSPRLAPAVNKVEGIAALYSPTRKAVELLDRQQYDNIDSLRVQLLNRGAKPDEVERVISRIGETSGPISKDRLAALADEQAGELQVRRVNANNSSIYSNENMYVTGYFVDGAENLQANVLELPVVNKPNFSEAHFRGSSPEAAPVMHTRTGMLSTKGANKPDSYHVGEIQSDWAQKRSKLFATGADVNKAQDRLTQIGREAGDGNQKLRELEQAIRDYGENPYLDPEWNRMSNELDVLDEERSGIFRRMQDHQTYGTRENFDRDYPAPYVGTTSKWVQLGLRQSLVDAVNSDARQMSLSTGEMVKSYTYGDLKGQQKFYDDIVPKELNEVLKKFAKEAGIKKPEVVMDTVFGSQGQAYTVPVLKFTDEFIDAIKRNGLPAFAKGGIVQGSLLDVDLFGDGA